MPVPVLGLGRIVLAVVGRSVWAGGGERETDGRMTDGTGTAARSPPLTLVA
jgi:hypothetical protein